uniref:rho guanine nucleotide exchange factor 12-like n=1 Tax=Pristiophorus japonicus TaxID=55135 RepID=UPI00398E6BC5
MFAEETNLGTAVSNAEDGTRPQEDIDRLVSHQKTSQVRAHDTMGESDWPSQTVQKPFKRLKNLQGSVPNKDLSPDKKHDKKNSEKSPLYEFDPTGLVQRCVIIQRDENGFGLTVSGDNPVFVQSVKEDGAAVRAGVQQGDRIIKVNGTLVTHSNHVEVVRLIKSGSYVALTVLGRPPGSPQIPLTTVDGDGGGFFFPGQQGPMSPNPTFSPHSPSSSLPERITSPMPVA